MKTLSVITGDITNFSKLGDARRSRLITETSALLDLLSSKPGHARIYRGDSYQIQINDPLEALHIALTLICWFRTNSDPGAGVNLSTRLSIGIGELAYEGETVLDSDGEAYHLAGRNFETLEKEELIRLSTSSEEKNDLYRIILMYINLLVANWTVAQAATILKLLEGSETQTEIAGAMKMSQPAVAKSLKASRWKEVEAGINFVNSELKKQYSL